MQYLRPMDAVGSHGARRFAARQLDELSADALRRRRAAAPLSLVSRYRRSQRKAPRNYRRIAALVAPCTFAHFADQMAGTDES